MTNETTILSPELAAKRAEKKELFTKKKVALRGNLEGRAFADPDWFRAIKAMNFAEKGFKGYRKDKVTPKFMHQVEIGLYILTLPTLLFPVRTLIAAMLHDTPEDTHTSHEEISNLVGEQSSDDVERVTKEYRGEKKDLVFYFAEIAKNPVSSIVKGVDRINNLFSMAGVFTYEKQLAYVEETETYFFAMLKEARRNFPEQALAYENIKFVIEAQLRVFRGAHEKGIAA